MIARGLALVVGVAVGSAAAAYPIDGFDYTGIRRLDYDRQAQAGRVAGALALPGGSLLSMDDVGLRGGGAVPDLPPADETLSRAIKDLLPREDAPRYGISLVDLTDPQRPVYAEHNGGYRQNIGSVGKLPVALAVFHELARAWPDDPERRLDVLREASVTADPIIRYDQHKVPIWTPGKRRFERRPLRIGDRGTLWEYLDWMMNSSSNAAAAMVMKHTIALRHFGRDYPPGDAGALGTFWRSTTPRRRGELLAAAMDEAMAASGLDSEQLRQGSLFTHQGKREVNGRSSYGTPREVARLLYRMEQGALVDDMSSRELKRLMYMTQKRIRYASHPALDNAAVFFKSGSLYSCQPEPDYECGKYAGNRINVLAAAIIIEAPAHSPRVRYIVAVVSNVLRKNSAVHHQTLAGRLHKLMLSRHPLTTTAHD